MTKSPVIYVHEYEDIIEHTVQHLLDTFDTFLPDLSTIVVFLPNPQAAVYFRKKLIQQLPASSNGCVIPPWCGTLNTWINEHIPLSDPSTTLISEQARRLIFIEALKQHTGLFKPENKWQVTFALLKLFDELQLHNTTVEKSATDWQNHIQQAYGLSTQHAHLQQEAYLVHTLWHAWKHQLEACGLIDSVGAYINRLTNATQHLAKNFHSYMVTQDSLYPCEQSFIELLSKQNLCTLVNHDEHIDNTDSVSARANSHAFIKTAFAYESQSLKQRAESFNKQTHSVKPPVSIFFSPNAETEAQAVDVQIRQWLLAGKKNIAVASEDRKHSRRLRALLERSNIPLQDMAGWSLATTSAAAVLERWLECIEENFDQRALLDLLKSHFFSPQFDHAGFDRAKFDRDGHLKNVYRLERDIILHENISHGIPRYRKHLKYRLNKLKNWPANTYDELLELLGLLEASAHPLQQLYHSKHAIPLKTFINALLASLDKLGIEHSFRLDPAGVIIIHILEDMQQSLLHSNPMMVWTDFRTWLGTTLEEQMFSPHTRTSAVQLMSLEQTATHRFDALIIAAVDEQHLPGRPATSPFFNQSVRQSLGLPIWKQERAQRLKKFQHALLSAPEILITCKIEERGEPLPLSPWIEALRNFYQLSFTQSIENRQLHALLAAKPSVFICDTERLPTPQQQPAPTLPEALFPERISASAHQRLINCPYQYFSNDALKLKPVDELREELQKSDYGERVHKILQAFHQPAHQRVKYLPEAFSEKITANNREQAIDYLTELSERVFKNDLEDNVLHRSWLHRWLKHIPNYIDWQIEQQKYCSILNTEINSEAAFDETVTLYGRLDRIDSCNQKHSVGNHAIIDYKTGQSARQYDVDNGEDVQLISYALLDDDADKVMYLSLDNPRGAVKTTACLSGEHLSSLAQASRLRLKNSLDLARNGHPLHAWGDDVVCHYCNFYGLCRRPAWKGNND